MLNLHRLFYHSTQGDSFHGVILPTAAQKERLTAAKNKIRDYLRDDIERASTTVLGQPQRVTPRFRTQGSWSYDLCNQPAHMPPQEMDWDLGVYLPVSVWEDSGPRFAAKAYYNLLEVSLRSLCARERWTIETRETCIRVFIGGGAHIDVPPYAAPDKQFAAIQERALAKALVLKEEVAFRDAVAFGEMPGEEWDTLKDIVLATLSGKWEKSDPAVVSDWFRDQVAQFGDQLKRVCRYLKAWRDFQWKEGGPTSVCLMICACQAFQKSPGRDDVALLEVARQLGEKLGTDVREEVINDEDFNKKLSVAERRDAAARANTLYRTLSDALEARGWQKATVLAAVAQQFGSRFPGNADWLTESTAQEIVRAAPAIAVAQPEVRRSRSG